MTDPNRLIYETSTGELSPSGTYEQLLEYVRLAEEDLRTLADLAKQRNDLQTAKRWTIIANNFRQIQEVLKHLAFGVTKTSVGYTGHA